jgi:hypothetical protein
MEASTTKLSATTMRTTQKTIEKKISTTTDGVSKMSATTTLASYKNDTPDDFEFTNASYHKLQPFDLKLKSSNAEKIMSIGMESDERFYLAKANGELEFFNWTTLESIRAEHLDVQIHRLAYLSDGRLVVTETQTKSLHLLDPDYKVIAQLKLGYQALDLQVFNDMVIRFFI